MVKKMLKFLAVILCIAAMSVTGSVCVKASSIAEEDYPYVGRKQTCKKDGCGIGYILPEEDYPYVGRKQTCKKDGCGIGYIIAEEDYPYIGR